MENDKIEFFLSYKAKKPQMPSFAIWCILLYIHVAIHRVVCVCGCIFSLFEGLDSVDRKIDGTFIRLSAHNLGSIVNMYKKIV